MYVLFNIYCIVLLFADILQNSCPQKFRKFHRKTPVFDSLFNKVVGLKACNFIKNRLRRRCFSVILTKLLRATFFTKHLRWLLLLLTG